MDKMRLLATAINLLTDEDDHANPEYDRAIVEMTAELLDLGGDREAVETMLKALRQ